MKPIGWFLIDWLINIVVSIEEIGDKKAKSDNHLSTIRWIPFQTTASLYAYSYRLS